MFRTHSCGELNKGDLNKEVTLSGWVASRRDHGKIIFIDLRDRYGITQVVFLPNAPNSVYLKAQGLRSEEVVRIKGKVNLRPKGTENPRLATGFVEVCAQEAELINSCEDLPFSIDDNTEAGEEIRLIHRYLDLRRKVVSQRLILRHKLNQGLRSFLNSKGFLEVETPYLSRSTPEGARDFLVPSRLNPGKFYALPQSPQLFKQILMVGGIDRYYQIVRCFRDEDLRKDRQPEFSQLDLELSFVDEEDIFSLAEGMIASLLKEVLGKEVKIPFPRIAYKEAKEKYGTDKPDLGKGEYRFLWVVDFPLFEYNDEDGRWQACHHPFTSPKESDLPLLDKELSLVRARSYDLILNGQEVGSGSIRIHSPALQKKIFKILGILPEVAEDKFGFLLRAFRYGAPPHGGIAFGLDRLCAIISGCESIREVIVFPKTQKGVCPLADAPSFVAGEQLDELYISLIEKEEEK